MLTTSKVMVFSDHMDASSLIAAVEQLMGPITDMYSQQVKDRSESIKPQAVMVRRYETAVYGFRDQRLPGEVKGVSTLLVESLEAFEAGRVLEAGRFVMQAVEQFEGAGKEAVVTITEEQAAKLGQFRSSLFKMINPGHEISQQDLAKKRAAAQSQW
jgi:hypothetical protein